MNTYPEFLYKYRDMLTHAVAKYRHIEGNIYEDMTCSDHTHCRISVKQVGDHYEFEKALNESAIKYTAYHRAVLGDTHFYADKETPLKVKLNAWIEKAENNISILEKKRDDVGIILAASGIQTIKTQDINDIDYDDTIYLAVRDDSTFKVTHKTYSKDGLCYLSGNGYTVSNTEDKKSLKVTFEDYDYEGNQNIERYTGFVSKEDLEAYRHNLELKRLNEDYERYEASIEGNKQDIARYKAELEKLEGC